MARVPDVFLQLPGRKLHTHIFLFTIQKYNVYISGRCSYVISVSMYHRYDGDLYSVQTMMLY